MWWLLAALTAPTLAQDAPPSTVRQCEDAVPLEAGKVPIGEAIRRVARVETDSGSGSGVVISPDGVILTASHVVADTERVKVVVGSDSTREGIVVKRRPEADLALVRIIGTEFPCLELADADPGVGSDIVAIGNPGGEALSQTVTRGIVSGIRMVDELPIVQTDAAINAGNSGGPLVDTNGKVVGIVSFKAVGGDAEGLGFAISARAVLETLDITLGDKTSDDLAKAAAPVGPVARRGLPPTITLGSGVTLPDAPRFDQKYRPRAGWLAGVGAVGAVTGAGMILGSASYDPDAAMPPSEWQSRVGVNTAGWTVLISSTSLAAFGLLPGHGGAVRRKP